MKRRIAQNLRLHTSMGSEHLHSNPTWLLFTCEILCKLLNHKHFLFHEICFMKCISGVGHFPFAKLTLSRIERIKICRIPSVNICGGKFYRSVHI